jgi:hypothetical protein
MAAKDTKTRNHPAHNRRQMPADVRALGNAGLFIQNAIRKSDAARRKVRKQ